MESKNNTMIASKVIELSEHPSYIELVDRVCYYDSSNANGVQLDYDESSLEKAQSLVDMPVVAYYLSDKNGKPSLGGHAVTRTKDGIKFGTSAIGVHTNVWIDDAEVELTSGETTTKKCLFSTMKIWNRYENMVSAVKRLYEENRLFNSWEISVSSYKFEDNTKKLIDYEFIGNALLGEAIPAYGSASRILSMASIEDEDPCLLIAEALSADLIGDDSASNIISNQLDDTNRKEGLSMDNESIIIETSNEDIKEETAEVVQTEEVAEIESEGEVNNEVAEVSNDDPVEESTTDQGVVESAASEDTNADEVVEEISTMKTERDIRRMIRDALNEKNDEDYMDVSFVFPEDRIILVQSWRMKELEFIQYSYRVDGDKIVLDNEKRVELNVSPLKINSELEIKNNAIAEANNRIVELENENAELSKVKEEFDKIQAEKAKAEHSEAVSKLNEYVVKSGMFTKDEIASEEIQNAINQLNESWLKAEIADRFIANLTDKKDNVDTSEVVNNDNTLSVVLSEEVKSATSEDIMRAFFNM